MPVPGPRERERARREAQEQMDEEDSGADSNGSSDDESYDQDGRQSSPNYTNPDSDDSEDSGASSGDSDSGSGSSGTVSRDELTPQDDAPADFNSGDSSSGDGGSSSSSGSGGSSAADLEGGDPDTGLKQSELDNMDAEVVGDTATNPTDEQIENLRSVARNQADPGEEVYLSRTPTGAMVAFAGSGAEQASETATRRAVAQQFEEQAEEVRNENLTPGEDFTVEETDSGFRAAYTERYRRRRAEEELERQLEEERGEDLTPGEDFTVEETEDGYQAALTNDYLEGQEQQDGQESTFVPDARARSQMGGDQGVRVAPVSEEEATADLEQQLEERLGRDVEPGEHFTVQETEQGFRAEPTDQLERELFREQLMQREDVDSPDDFEITKEDGGFQARIQPDRREEDFVEGAFSAVDDVLSPAVSSYEAQSGLDIPGEGAIGTTDTGSPEQISGGARDAVGVENTTSVAEATDQTLGETDDDARAKLDNLGGALTDPEAYVEAAESADQEIDEFYRSTPVLNRVQERAEQMPDNERDAVLSTVVVGRTANVGRGGVGAARASDDILKALGITGAAAGAGVASQEVDVPEEKERSELEVSESVSGAEVTVPEDASRSEVEVPEERGPQSEVDVVREGEQRATIRRSGDGEVTVPIWSQELIGRQQEQGVNDRREQSQERTNVPEEMIPEGTVTIGESDSEEGGGGEVQRRYNERRDSLAGVVGEGQVREAQQRQERAQESLQEQVWEENLDTATANSGVADVAPAPVTRSMTWETVLSREETGEEVSQPSMQAQAQSQQQAQSQRQGQGNPQAFSVQAPASPSNPTRAETSFFDGDVGVNYPQSTRSSSSDSRRPRFWDSEEQQSSQEAASSQSTSTEGQEAFEAGWYSEYVAALAGSDRGSPSQQQLQQAADDGFGAGSLPVAAEASEDEEFQAVSDFLAGEGTGLNFGDDEDDGGGFW